MYTFVDGGDPTMTVLVAAFPFDTAVSIRQRSIE